MRKSNIAARDSLVPASFFYSFYPQFRVLIVLAALTPVLIEIGIDFLPNQVFGILSYSHHSTHFSEISYIDSNFSAPIA